MCRKASSIGQFELFESIFDTSYIWEICLRSTLIWESICEGHFFIGNSARDVIVLTIDLVRMMQSSMGVQRASRGWDGPRARACARKATQRADGWDRASCANPRLDEKGIVRIEPSAKRNRRTRVFRASPAFVPKVSPQTFSRATFCRAVNSRDSWFIERETRTTIARVADSITRRVRLDARAANRDDTTFLAVESAHTVCTSQKIIASTNTRLCSRNVVRRKSRFLIPGTRGKKRCFHTFVPK